VTASSFAIGDVVGFTSAEALPCLAGNSAQPLRRGHVALRQRIAEVDDDE
jgi:hypothetical protein